jgi:multidrug resistance efflux pump
MKALYYSSNSAIIGKANSFLLELEVDENDMVRVAIGQKAIVTLDSYKGEVLKRSLIKFSNYGCRSHL